MKLVDIESLQTIWEINELSTEATRVSPPLHLNITNLKYKRDSKPDSELVLASLGCLAST